MQQMVKHIIIWTLKEMSDEEKKTVKADIKAGLEALKGKTVEQLEALHNSMFAEEKNISQPRCRVRPARTQSSSLCQQAY